MMTEKKDELMFLFGGFAESTGKGHRRRKIPRRGADSMPFFKVLEKVE